MLWQTLFHLCLFFIPGLRGFGPRTDSEPVDCNNRAPTTMQRLKQKLLCGYDRDIRPVSHHTNKTSVSLIIAPRVITFKDYDSELRVKTWLSMHWKDYQLVWEKIEYDGIEQLTLDTSMVWMPDLSVYNTQEENDASLDHHVAPIMISSNGEVYAFMSPVLTGRCIPTWNNWPHDIHECTITLGSKRYLGSTVDFHFLTGVNGLWLKYLLPNNEWELIKTNSSRNETHIGPKNETNPLYLVSLNYVFTIRRHSAVYVATYIFPGIVMVIMSLGLLWIPSHRIERIAILCTLAIQQCLSLHWLSQMIHANGDTTPYLMCFYRDCLFLTALLVIETIVTRSLYSCTLSPSYLQSTFRLVASNKVLQILLVNDLDPKSAAKLMDSGNDEGSTLVAEEENTRQWQMFVNIVNRVCFVLLVPIYFLLSVSLLPVNYSFSPN